MNSSQLFYVQHSTGGRGGFHGQSVKDQDRRCFCFCPRLVGNCEREVNCVSGRYPYMTSKTKGGGIKKYSKFVER